jgi:hypothetical protein
LTSANEGLEKALDVLERAAFETTPATPTGPETASRGLVLAFVAYRTATTGKTVTANIPAWHVTR